MRYGPVLRGAAVGLLAACLAAGPAGAQAVRINPAWLRDDRASSTAEFTLLAGLNGLNGGMNFNGATSGALTVTVPLDWHVVLHFRNEDQMLPHSAVVIPAVSPVPPMAGRPAFDGATTDQPEQGLSPGGHQDVRFVASRAGDYMIFCAVPGHGMAGMWIRFVVSASAARPSVESAPAGHG